MCLTLGLILFLYIHILYIVILYYTLPSLLYSSPILSSIPFPLFPCSLLSTYLDHLIHSIRVGTKIDLLIFPTPIFPKLTPHVLSEWMVEVCGPYLCGVGRYRYQVERLTLGVILYIFLLLLLYIHIHTYIINYILYSSFLSSPLSPPIFLFFPIILLSCSSSPNIHSFPTPQNHSVLPFHP